MKLRERLTYANVASTLALVLAMTGGAYAAGFIDSGDIENNSIESRDLKNKDVKGVDVRGNALTGREIKEKTLNASVLAPLTGRDVPGCDPVLGEGASECGGAEIRLPSRGRVLVIATGEFAGNGELACRIRADNQSVGSVATPSTGGAGTDGFSLTLVTQRLASGKHRLSLRCEETQADGLLTSASIAILGIGG